MGERRAGPGARHTRLRRLLRTYRHGMARYLGLPDGPEKAHMPDALGDHWYVLADEMEKVTSKLLRRRHG